MKYNRVKHLFYIFLLTGLSMNVFLVAIDPVSVVEGGHKTFWELFLPSVSPLEGNMVLIMFLIYYFYYSTYFDGKKICRWNVILSSVASFCTIMGLCYFTMDSSLGILFSSVVQVYKFILLFVGYYVIYYAILKRVSRVEFNMIVLKEKAVEVVSNKKVMTRIFLIFFVWLMAFLFVYYPGGATGDTADSIFQFFHSDASWTIQTIELKNPDVYINKHHSVFFTIILGSFMKIGSWISSYEFGFFLFVFVQVLILCLVFAFMLSYMRKLGVPKWLIILSLFYLLLSPIVIKYSITAVKDTLSAIFTVVYVIFLIQIVRDYQSVFRKRWRLVAFVVTILLILLLRNNGIYTFLFSFPFLFILYKKYWKELMKVLLLVLVIFFSYDGLLLPSLGVSNGSIREVLSIPFMQIARTAKYHREDFSEGEVKQINKVLDFDFIISNYYPDLADNVKNTYQKTATKEEVGDLFRIWVRYFKKYPLLYVDSFLNSTYGYFYARLTSIEENPKYLFNGYFVYNEEENTGYISDYDDKVKVLNSFFCVYYSSPFIACFYNVAVVDWVLILSIVLLLRKKCYRYLIPLLPLLSVLLVCLASPVNGSMRYVLPILFSIPIILGLDYCVLYGRGKEI